MRNNSEFIIQNSECDGGFTLIELMVAVSVMAVLSAITTGILFSSLRGSSKTNVITTVKENGNYAVSQVARLLRYAKKFDGVSTSTDGTGYTPVCVATTQYKAIKVIASDDTVGEFICSDSAPQTLTFGGLSLLDTSSVSVVTCHFTCNRQTVSDFPTIGITLSLREALTGATQVTLEKRTEPILFQTSVSLRNAR